jgi:hypothetical protein
MGTETAAGTMRHAIGNGLIIGMSAALLWHFSNIWRYGQYVIGEPNIVIRSLETAGLLTIFIFGISNLIMSMKRENRREDTGRSPKK